MPTSKRQMARYGRANSFGRRAVSSTAAGTLNMAVARWLSLLPLMLVVGCEQEPDYGSFRMSSSDDSQAEISGQAVSHSTFESGYYLGFDLRWTASKFFDPNGLYFDF